MTLQEHMDLCYRERHGIPRAAGSIRRFIGALREDPALAAQARTHLATAFDDQVLRRDHISRVHKQNLEAATNAAI